MPAPSNLAGLLAPGAKARHLDLQALLAIAAHEGASGGIGDGGHAFGPFQLNDAGGVLTGKLAGMTPEQKNAWAWSPAGIKYALDGIGHVASGKQGDAAITAIARDFERPANVGAEIADARAHYGKSGVASVPAPQGSAPRPSAPSPTAGSSGIDSLLGGLIGRANDTLGLGGGPDIGSLLGAAWSGHPGSGATVGGKPGQGQAGLPPLPKPKASGTGGIVELLREGVGGPTHSTGPHIHAAFTDPNVALQAIQWAQQHGLHVGENPYTGDTVDPVHAPNSYHTRTFPGIYHGRKLGEAVDVTGPNMGAFYQYLVQRRGAPKA